MQRGLSFESTPPFGAPLRFFLTAPLFAVAAGLLAVVQGEAVFASRWTPAALAATHLLTVGFMLQIMIGALIQILPVVAGASIGRPLAVARIVHAALTAGTALLAGGFLAGSPWMLQTGAAALLCGGGVFLMAALPPLLRAPSTSPTIRGLKCALLALFIALGLGGLLAFALARGWPLPFFALADLHAAWGLGGWAGILLAAVAFVVVPMFQLTPGYPARTSWHWPLWIAGALLGWSAGVVLGLAGVVQAGQMILALAGIAFAMLTLRLQGQRRRAKSDVTFRYWQLGLATTIFALIFLSTAAVRPQAADAHAWAPAFGVLLIAGGFVSFIVGMLYKIVPFLAWLHLQDCGRQRVAAPPMNRLLPDRDAERQWLAHVAALLLGLLAVAFPETFSRLAGLAFALASAWLGWNLAAAARRYRRHSREIAAKLAEKKGQEKETGKEAA